MARGDKDYNKKVRSVKGKNSKKKVDTVHKMVETELFVQSMIKGDETQAKAALSARMQQILRGKVMGEGVIELEIDDEDGYDDEEGYDEEGEGDELDLDAEDDGDIDLDLEDEDEYSDEDELDLDAEEGDDDLDLDDEDGEYSDDEELEL